jgi:hypothetical protein
VRIEQVDSDKCNLVQMVDVIIGGIAHSRNFPEPSHDAVSYKGELAEYVLKGSKLETWAADTERKARRLTVWNFHHQKLIAGEKAPQGARRYIRQG